MGISVGTASTPASCTCTSQERDEPNDLDLTTCTNDKKRSLRAKNTVLDRPGEENHLIEVRIHGLQALCGSEFLASRLALCLLAEPRLVPLIDVPLRLGLHIAQR